MQTSINAVVDVGIHVFIPNSPRCVFSYFKKLGRTNISLLEATNSNICHNIVHCECIHLDDIKVLF
jgi:hypothetical protein